MNIQQLEYIIAVDTYRHFATASEKCFVTQPTLSMMIRKLEDELDIKIFDRGRQPVVPTEAGVEIIRQARNVLKEVGRIGELVSQYKGDISGELHLGVIPTLAPYLLPLFMDSFLKRYPGVQLSVSELTTKEIMDQLKSRQLDAAILATPLKDNELDEQVLFYERFLVYASTGETVLKRKHVLSSDIDPSRLWLLEEGHCLRSQVLSLCELRSGVKRRLSYEAGSISTLIKIVDAHKGITIIPELAVNDLTIAQKGKIRPFRSPAPSREISLVTYRYYSKDRMTAALSSEIQKIIPASMTRHKTEVLPPGY